MLKVLKIVLLNTLEKEEWIQCKKHEDYAFEGEDIVFWSKLVHSAKQKKNLFHRAKLDYEVKLFDFCLCIICFNI